MTSPVKNSFSLRRTANTPLAGGHWGCEEDFYINQDIPRSPQNILYCFACGDCLWRRGYQQEISGTGYTWWAFNYIVEGDGIVVCNQVRYQLDPGDVYLSRPGRKMSIRCGPSGFFRKKTILLRGRMIDQFCQSARLDDTVVVRTQASRKLERIFKSIKDLVLSRKTHLWEDIDVQAYALVLELARLAAPSQYPPPLYHAIMLVDGRLGASHTLESLSRECNVSLSTLSRLFHRHLRISPMSYIINRRLQQAELLIQLDKMTFKEVAERCGYKSRSFFSRSFKKKYGVSPAGFRARQRAEKR